MNTQEAMNSVFDSVNLQLNTTSVGTASGNTGLSGSTHYEISEIWDAVVNSSGQVRTVS
jgi:hypothetical protein